MTVILERCNPPLNEVALLGSNPLRVYTVMYESAAHDIRGNCGGTTSWTIKGLANELSIKRETVARAIDKLLDNGFIQIIGQSYNSGLSNNIVWRVTHPDMLDAVRYSIEMMGPPSERLAKMRVKEKKIKYTDHQPYEIDEL